ncbi:MAG TPA: glycosyltransferase [bacterium]|nr:glycosyltransferase [bacterium]
MKRVTVAIIAYNEARNLPDTLTSLAAQTYPRERFEILVVDNGSNDGTRALVREWMRRLDNLRLAVEPTPGIAPARNTALRETKTELIVFTDADVICPPTWLQTLVEGFDRHRERDLRTVAVGGGNVPVAAGSRFLAALGVTLNSFWGSHGSAQGMLHEEDRIVEHIPTLNICYDRLAVLAAGGFDNAFRMVSEDPELNHRLTRLGYRIVFLAGAQVEHKMRPDLRSWFRNVYVYGRGRTQIIKKHPDHFRLKYAAPPLIPLVLAAFVLAPWLPLLALPLPLYLAATALLARRLCARQGKRHLWSMAFVILAGNPIAYGIGMIHGLWHRYPPSSPRPIID